MTDAIAHLVALREHLDGGTDGDCLDHCCRPGGFE